MYIFQYLVGNGDWSHTHFHNVKLMRVGFEYFPVPYDFDFTGFVDAPYATPPEGSGLDGVRDRRSTAAPALTGSTTGLFLPSSTVGARRSGTSLPHNPC